MPKNMLQEKQVHGRRGVSAVSALLEQTAGLEQWGQPGGEVMCARGAAQLLLGVGEQDFNTGLCLKGKRLHKHIVPAGTAPGGRSWVAQGSRGEKSPGGLK